MGHLGRTARGPRRGLAQQRRTSSRMAFVAAQRLITAAHAQALLGCPAGLLTRLRALCARAPEREPVHFTAGRGASAHRRPDAADGIAAGAGSTCAPIEHEARRRVAVAGGGRRRFGPVRGGARRAADALARRAAANGGAPARRQARRSRAGDGRERLHYPDLLLITPRGAPDRAGARAVLERTRTRREKILAGYAADARIDAVLYLVKDRPDRDGRFRNRPGGWGSGRSSTSSASSLARRTARRAPPGGRADACACRARPAAVSNAMSRPSARTGCSRALVAARERPWRGSRAALVGVALAVTAVRGGARGRARPRCRGPCAAERDPAWLGRAGCPGVDRRARARRSRPDPRRQRRRQDHHAARDRARADQAGATGRRDRHEGVAGIRGGARGCGGGERTPVPDLDARRSEPLEPAGARQRNGAQGQADRDGAVHRASLSARRGALRPDRPSGRSRAHIPSGRRRSRRWSG